MSDTDIPLKSKLSQWEALTLESLRKFDWSNEQLVERVASGELPTDESKFHFDYSLLTELMKNDEATFVNAVNYGYTIKYNTIRGIHSWILITLGVEGLLELEPTKEAIYARLTPEQAAQLQAVLSYGWQISFAQSLPEQYRDEQNEDSSDNTYAVYEVKLIQTEGDLC